MFLPFTQDSNASPRVTSSSLDDILSTVPVANETTLKIVYRNFFFFCQAKNTVDFLVNSQKNRIVPLAVTVKLSAYST